MENQIEFEALLVKHLDQVLATDAHRALKHIMIIEDDLSLEPLFRKVISKIDPNVQVDWFSSAEEFLEREASGKLPPWQKYDLVLTDIYTPGESSGFDVWKHFIKRSPLTPVVMMSGMPQYDFFKSMGSAVIAPPYLEKPLDVHECRTMIQGFLSRGISR